MTVKGLYEAMLIELNKIEAPSLLLEDFNYLLNKAIYQYTNKWYNQYDVNQQTSDNLRVLKSTAALSVDASASASASASALGDLYSSVKVLELPADYFHILNCVCEYIVNKPYKCYVAGSKVHFKASRLTSDMWGSIINNFYMKPSYKKPYFFVHNVNTTDNFTTNIISNSNKFGTDTLGNNYEAVYNLTEQAPLQEGYYTTTTAAAKLKELNIQPKVVVLQVSEHAWGKFIYNGGELSPYSAGNDEDLYIKNSNFDTNITIGGYNYSTVERTSGVRYGNPSPIRLEIRYGKDSSVFTLNKVYIDYLKVPQTVVLTQEQLDAVEDLTQILEFPDYVCYEIINELVKLVMENASDPRLQTHIPVNQTIAPPAGFSQKQ